MNPPIVDHLETTPYVPVGHPVRSFVLLLVGAGTLALALWWSGLLAPRLDTGGGSAGSFDQETLEGDLQLSVHNAGPLPIRIEQVTVGGPGYRSTGAALLVPDPEPDTFGGEDLPAFAPTDLAPGEFAELAIRFSVDECRTTDPEVAVRVRTAAGLRRSVDIGGQDQMELFCANSHSG